MIDILIEKQNLVLISLDWHPDIMASLLAKTTYRGTIIKLGIAEWMTRFGFRLIFNQKILSQLRKLNFSVVIVR